MLYSITSKMTFRNDAFEKITYCVFVVKNSKEDAKIAAIEQFKSYIDDMKQSFNALEKMLDDRERSECYNDNPGLDSLYHAAKGDVDIHELGSISQVETINV